MSSCERSNQDTEPDRSFDALSAVHKLRHLNSLGHVRSMSVTSWTNSSSAKTKRGTSVNGGDEYHKGNQAVCRSMVGFVSNFGHARDLGLRVASPSSPHQQQVQ